MLVWNGNAYKYSCNYDIFSDESFVEQVKMFVWVEVFVGSLYGIAGLMMYGGTI